MAAKVGAIVHSDIVQAVGKLKVDLMTVLMQLVYLVMC